MERPTVLDLFAGVGGFSLGFEQAGFDVVAAIEIDPIHAACHKYNFPQCAVIPRSVKDLSAPTIRAFTGIRDRRVDVVIGGPPCQGFSTMGLRALDDPRNALVRDFVRIVCEVEASYFVFENVKGLTFGKHRLFLDELIRDFRERGYLVRTPWRLLNSAHYGVPQHRERVVLIGARSDCPLPFYPIPSTQPAGSESVLGLLPRGPSCEQALDDLPDAEYFGELVYSDSVRTDRWGVPSPYAAELRCATPEAWHRGYRRAWDPTQLTASMRTNHSAASRKRFLQTPASAIEPISRFFRLPPTGVSNTLRAGTDSSRGAFTSPRPIHHRYGRCVTVREMARLHGFPDWFRFHATKWHGARQVGNAVTPPLARAIAEGVLGAMSIAPAQPDAILELHSPALLNFGMKQASKYWNVEPAIGKRDRKSKRTKRMRP